MKTKYFTHYYTHEVIKTNTLKEYKNAKLIGYEKPTFFEESKIIYAPYIPLIKTPFVMDDGNFKSRCLGKLYFIWYKVLNWLKIKPKNTNHFGVNIRETFQNIAKIKK